MDLEVGAQFSTKCAPVSDSRAVRDVCEYVPFGKCPYESWFGIPAELVGYKTLRVSWPASVRIRYFLAISYYSCAFALEAS